MTFDQLSRYRACAEILKQISNCGSILDVGSGPECLLGNHFENREITYVDPLLVNIDAQDAKLIEGNVFNSKLDNRKFDYVCSVDTLEHVPEESRNAFIERISNLACKGIVLGFPCSDDNVAHETDIVIDTAFRKAFNRPNFWIEEHLNFGLPKKEDVIHQLKDLGWSISLVGHGHAPWLKLLLSIVVFGWEIAEARPEILRFSKQFNDDLYQYDFNPPFYRWYVVASKDTLSSVRFKFGSPINNAATNLFIEMYTDVLYSILALILNSGDLFALNSINSANRLNEIANWAKSLQSNLEESDRLILDLESKHGASLKLQSQIDEIVTSKAWRFVLALRRFRCWLIPVDSFQERIARRLFFISKGIFSKGSRFVALLRKAKNSLKDNGSLKTVTKIKNRINTKKREVISYEYLLSKFPEQLMVPSKILKNPKSLSKAIDSFAKPAIGRLLSLVKISCDVENTFCAMKNCVDKSKYFQLLEDLFTLDELLYSHVDGRFIPLIKASELPEEAWPKRRRRILFITAQAPSSYHGGGNRVINFIKVLSENNDIYLCTSYIENEDEPILQAIEPYCKSICKIPHWNFGGNQALIHKWIKRIPIDIIHYEWPHSLSNYDRTFGKYQIFTYMEAVSLRLLIDMEFTKPFSAEWVDKLVLLINMLRIELADVTSLDARIAVTVKDGDFFKNIFPYQEYVVLNHGLSFDDFMLPDIETEPNTLMFIGNYKHPPNEDAMTHFFNNIWENICTEVPDVRIYLVGANPSETMMRLADNKRIIVTGRVPDVRPYIQKASVCIAPLISGAGLRGKVIEYAALRRTFVATSIATTDLVFRDGIDYVCADTAEDFYQNVIKLLKDKSMRTKMGLSAFETARQNYDTRHLVGFLNRLYNRMENRSLAKNQILS